MVQPPNAVKLIKVEEKNGTNRHLDIRTDGLYLSKGEFNKDPTKGAVNLYVDGSITTINNGKLEVSGSATINGGATIESNVGNNGSQIKVETGDITLSSHRSTKGSSIRLNHNGTVINGGATINGAFVWREGMNSWSSVPNPDEGYDNVYIKWSDFISATPKKIANGASAGGYLIKAKVKNKTGYTLKVNLGKDNDKMPNNSFAIIGLSWEIPGGAIVNKTIKLCIEGKELFTHHYTADGSDTNGVDYIMLYKLWDSSFFVLSTKQE